MITQHRISCSRCLVHRILDTPNSDEARRMAERAGWVISVFGDVCSKCAPPSKEAA